MFFSVAIALSVIAHSSDMNRDINTTAQTKTIMIYQQITR
jgi:hypothetical protein